MVREIMRDKLFLSQPSAPAMPEDAAAADDLLETLMGYKDGCVSMAANMIGVRRRRAVSLPTFPPRSSSTSSTTATGF